MKKSMPDKNKTLIMKFGGGVLEGSQNFHRIAELIAQKKKSYKRICVVLSAMRGVTNHLISLANSVSSNPPSREMDMLVSVGERVSISLLAMALHEREVEAVSFTGSQSGVITNEKHGEAKIVDVRPHRLLPHLSRGDVVIVAGFQGMSLQREITTLGRGGSDTTAVALAVALSGERVLFYKDVPGICTDDPKLVAGSKLFNQLSYEQAISIVEQTGGVLSKRAINLAQKNALLLQVLPFWEDEQEGTVIGMKEEGKERLYELSTHCNAV